MSQYSEKEPTPSSNPPSQLEQLKGVWKKYKNYNEHKDKYPPVATNNLLVILSKLARFSEGNARVNATYGWAEQTGADITYVPGADLYLITGHEAAEQAMAANKETERHPLQQSVSHVGEIFGGEGEGYHKMRKLAIDTLSPHRVRESMDALRALTRDAMEDWKRKMADGSFDLTHEVYELMDEIVPRILNGGHNMPKTLSEKMQQLLPLAIEVEGNRAQAPQKNWPKIKHHKEFEQLSAEVLDIFTRFIRKAQHSPDRENLGIMTALIHRMEADPESGNYLTVEQAMKEALGMVIAARETTANSIIWAMIGAARNKTVFQNLRIESQQVRGEKGYVENDQLSELIYAEDVFYEAVRWRTPVPIGMRVATESFELGSYMVPKDALLLILLQAAQNDKTVFGDNAAEFDPDRFMQNPDLKKAVLGWMKGNIHVCKGMHLSIVEGKIILEEIAHNFQDIEMDDDFEAIPDFSGTQAPPALGKRKGKTQPTLRLFSRKTHQ